MNLLMMVVGLLVTSSGLIWIGQSKGVVAWPKRSFMVNNPKWTSRGIVTAIIGFIIFLIAFLIA